MNPLLHEAIQDLRAEVRMLRADNDRLSRMVTGLSALAESRRVAMEEALREEPRGITALEVDAWRERIMKIAEGGAP